MRVYGVVAGAGPAVAFRERVNFDLMSNSEYMNIFPNHWEHGEPDRQYLITSAIWIQSF